MAEGEGFTQDSEFNTLAKNKRTPGSEGFQQLTERLYTQKQTTLADLEVDARWIPWCEESDPGNPSKPRKVPYSPHRKGRAVGPHSTWGGTYKAARDRRQELRKQFPNGGVGIVLGNGLLGIDLDNCLDPDTGKTAPWAKRVIDHFDTYCERSPSGRGYKLFMRCSESERKRILNALGRKPDGQQIHGRNFKHKADGGKAPGIEAYAGERYFTVTDDIRPGSPETLALVTADEFLWAIDVAGPEFMGSAKSDPTGETESGFQDESQSGIGWRMAVEAARNGDSFEDYLEQLADREDVDRWRDDTRQVDRAYANAIAKADKERDELISKFDDLGPLPVSNRKKFAALRLHRMSELDSMPEPVELIQDVLFQEQLSAIIGQPSVGKSFTAIDMGMHIATGRHWQEKEVEQGGVVFIALEGVHGFRKRLKAWCKKHKIKDLDTLPVAVIDGTLNLREGKESRKWIIEQIAQLKFEWGIPIRLIVIDTLNRAMAGGNESASEDMGALIAGLDQIRSATKAHAMVLHHPGKDEAKGARGHSSLLGALDTEIMITSQGRKRVMEITKQKEGEDGARFTFELEKITLDYVDRRGNPVTSAVAMPYGSSGFEDLTEFDPRQGAALTILRGMFKRAKEVARLMGDDPASVGVELEDWRAQLRETDWPDKDTSNGAFRVAWKRLKSDSKILERVEISGERVTWR